MLIKFYSKCLDLLVGFGGHETMPHDVEPFVNGLVQNVGIHGMGEDIWDVVRDSVISFPDTVKSNTVIAVIAKDDGFYAREIGMHRKERPLGYDFTQCGNPVCPSMNRRGHINGELRDLTVARIRCKTCKWKSRSVRVVNHPLIKPLHETRAPLLFYHAFPSPAGLSSMFLTE